MAARLGSQTPVSGSDHNEVPGHGVRMPPGVHARVDDYMLEIDRIRYIRIVLVAVHDTLNRRV